jgi:hypothetical protein
MGTGLYKMVNGETIELTNAEKKAIDDRRKALDLEITGVRSTRDDILNRSDKAMIEDYPKSAGTTDEWKAYRVELRDCLTGFKKVSTFVFPKSPIVKKAGQDAYDKKKSDGLTDADYVSSGKDTNFKDEATDSQKATLLEECAERDREGAELLAGYPFPGL